MDAKQLTWGLVAVGLAFWFWPRVSKPVRVPDHYNTRPRTPGDRRTERGKSGATVPATNPDTPTHDETVTFTVEDIEPETITFVDGPEEFGTGGAAGGY